MRLSRVCMLLSAALLCGAAKLQDEAVGKDGWLRGDTRAKFDILANQLRGLDLAMIEIDHRFHELYWAGQDQNWKYAEYQLEKIETSLNHALQRRPKRNPSAKLFLETALPMVRSAVAHEQPREFADAFVGLTAACNNCHVSERVEYMIVRPPTQRRSSVYGR